MPAYLEAFYTGPNRERLLPTGAGAEWETDEETNAAFESLRPFNVPGHGLFLVDLKADNDDILDTLEITAEKFTEITGHPVRPREVYEAIEANLDAGMTQKEALDAALAA